MQVNTAYVINDFERLNDMGVNYWVPKKPKCPTQTSPILELGVHQ